MRSEKFNKIWDRILGEAVTACASDIHLEPFEHAHGGEYRLRLRVAKTLVEHNVFTTEAGDLLIDKLKSMAGLDIAETTVPQDGRLERLELRCDFRVNIIPCLGGAKAVLRLLPKDHRPRLDNLGIADNACKVLRASLKTSAGLIVIAGATGSGKTTTLHALLAELDSTKLNIVTLENPVEYRFPGLTQIDVTGRLSFALGLRAILRQDPDVILVGEVRDEETAVLALQAAGTGHLVLTTLHANSATDVSARLGELGCDRNLLRRHLLLSAFQKLVVEDGRLHAEINWTCGGEACA